MLMLNSDVLCNLEHNIRNFNTSYVNVKRYTEILRSHFGVNFNTSYVNVKL